MVDNRYATALVIGSVLSLLAAVYLSAAVGTQHWFQYSSPPLNRSTNVSRLRDDFRRSSLSERNHTDILLRLNGTLGLWWRCIQVPSDAGNKVETSCECFTFNQQLAPKYKTSNANGEEDLLRTYLWRCQFLLPLVSLGLVLLSGLVGVCACLCRSFTPTLVVGVLHFFAGICTLGTVCCFRAGVSLIHYNHNTPSSAVQGSMGWSLYLALISFPLQMMAAALFLWAGKSHRKSYTRMMAYRVA